MFAMRDDIERLFPEANVITWRWRDADTLLPGPLSAILGAYRHVTQQGQELADDLLSRDVSGQQVHFIGHSFGSHVNAHAALSMAGAGVEIDQFTILDRPWGIVPGWSDIEMEIFDLALERIAWGDNYYGNEQSSGTPAFGAPLARTCNRLIPGANHTEVHEFYARTIPEAADIRDSDISRQGDGFYWSAFGGGADQRRTPPCTTIPEKELVFFSAAAR